MSGRWTPGPWVHAYYKAEYGPLILGPNQETICECHYPEAGSANSERNYDQANANACLISTSPDLFDALKEIVSLATGPCNTRDMTEALDRARAALAKAKGEGA